MKSIVLLSSGLDSTVAFKEAYDRSDEIVCLTFDYGQQARMKEIEYAKKICEIFDIEHTVIDLPWYRNFRGALTDSGPLPELAADELDSIDKTEVSAKRVWVPGRNIVFLSIGAAFAENSGFDSIVTGFDAEEAATFPDNSPRFIELFDSVLEYGTLNKVSVFAPLLHFNKEEIVRRGFNVGAPLEWSWSCYRGEDVPCKRCESCLRRQRAFERAGMEDPLLLRL